MFSHLALVYAYSVPQPTIGAATGSAGNFSTRYSPMGIVPPSRRASAPAPAPATIAITNTTTASAAVPPPPTTAAAAVAAGGAALTQASPVDLAALTPYDKYLLMKVGACRALLPASSNTLQHGMSLRGPRLLCSS
jgi:hypothetical protein